jgi:hypothetical protein
MEINGYSINEIEELLKSLNENEILKWIHKLIIAFEETESHEDRNKLSILLADYGKNLAVEPIIRMIKDPKTLGHRGTLLYSLEELDYSKHLELIFSLILSENFEASRQAFCLIEKSFEKTSTDTLFYKKQIPLLIEKIRFLQDDINFYISAIELIIK